MNRAAATSARSTRRRKGRGAAQRRRLLLVGSGWLYRGGGRLQISRRRLRSRQTAAFPLVRLGQVEIDQRRLQPGSISVVGAQRTNFNFPDRGPLGFTSTSRAFIWPIMMPARLNSSGIWALGARAQIGPDKRE
jgi:hypothetical protein